MAERKRVCCITATRAEYSRLRSVLRAMNAHDCIDLQIVCSGTHLLDRYGSSLDDVVDDGFEVAATCFTLVEGETPTTMSKSLGLGISEYSTVLANLRPDVLLVMGDRFDAMASAITGACMNIPIAHIQGGEVSGSIDESLRHAITKLAHLHFPATESSRQRILSMGEQPDAVFTVGCPAVDSLLETPLLPLDELLVHPLLTPSRRRRRPFLADEGYVLATFHPVTTRYDALEQETLALLGALDELGENVFWVWPNADAGARKIVRAVDNYLAERGTDRFEFFDHVPMDLFVSLMARSKLMVGNSSAGIREACYFGVPVVDVGTRQTGRERAENVADVPSGERHAILAAMRYQREHSKYPVYDIYGDGKAGDRIAAIIAGTAIPPTQKRFSDGGSSSGLSSRGGTG